MNILIADKFETVGIDGLKKLGCEVIQRTGMSARELKDKVRETGCRILIVRSTKVPRDLLASAPELAMVVRAGAGYDTIDVDAATEHGVRVCNCPGKNSVAVAELTLGFMIALDRRIVEETADLQHRVWNKKEYSKARGLKGRTLGVVGLGSVGYEVARRAAAFDMKLLYADVTPRPAIERELGLRRVPLDELLSQSDFVTLHVPGDKVTRHMIGPDELRRMKKTAFLINCSRGGIVDEHALGEAIKNGVIAGAALDVYEVEPAAADTEFIDPILMVPHVVGTHHVGASTEQAQTAIAEEVVRIVKAYRDHGELVNCVNPVKE